MTPDPEHPITASEVSVQRAGTSNLQWTEWLSFACLLIAIGMLYFKIQGGTDLFAASMGALFRGMNSK